MRVDESQPFYYISICMNIIDNIINTGITEARTYYDSMFSRIKTRYNTLRNKYDEDFDRLEAMLADRGYKIVSFDTGFEAAKNDYYNPRIRAYNSNFSFVLNIQKNPDNGIIPLNFKVSTAKYYKDMLYLSIKHNSPKQKKKYPVQYWIDSACCQTPFVQLFAKSSPEIIDTFFLALDGLSNIKSEHDYNKYVSLTCKAIKENHELIRELKKL